METLCRGFLTGAINGPDDFAADDYRRSDPRFPGGNFERNLELVRSLELVKVQLLAARTGDNPQSAWLGQGSGAGEKRRPPFQAPGGASILRRTPRQSILPFRRAFFAP